ncbi:MAG: ATP synthase F0 sector subunit a [uncultured Campylobacterales bacterium]|uniref:ATP synthase subunit a n=1 Tax=uncultured Campylobacterales bacterium TaxID=352960 RepID=A0A6S6TDP1_9BACT|nr:MAG: ATP synthase F0 sector subunit a [uncultured Campylobacterales bacterium]
MGEIFTFIGIFTKDSPHYHDYVYLFHVGLVALIVFILAKVATKKMTIVPGRIQNIFELYINGVLSMGEDVLSEKAKRYIPLIASLGLFIFVANIIGLIPGFESPTAFLDFTLALTLIVFLYYHFEGARENGIVAYLGHFAGSPDMPLALRIFIFPIEIISHLSRVVSLSFRLFGNIKGDDLFLAVLLFLVPVYVPGIAFPAYGMLFIMAFLQTFVFMILSYVYIASAVEIDH